MIAEIKDDLRIRSITDAGRLVDGKGDDGKKVKKKTEFRTVSLCNEDKTISVTIKTEKRFHPLKELDNKKDISLESAIIIKVGDPFQKKLN